MDDNGGVRIGLADIWKAQQETTRAITDVNLTLTKIWGHLEVIDQRDIQSDLVQKDHEGRLKVIEGVIGAVDPKGLDARIRALEHAQISEDAIKAARTRARAAFWAAAGAIATAILALIGSINHFHL